MTHIFVSHATFDDKKATQLTKELEAATGLQFWIEHDEITLGHPNWRNGIHFALRDCRACLLVLSKTSVTRPEVTAEWTYHLKTGNPLYIAVIDDVADKDINPRLHIIQWAFLNRDWEKGVKALADAMAGRRQDPDAPVEILRPITGRIEENLLAIPMTGRDDELKAVQEDLGKGVTFILGVGGLGKSRLAVETALHTPNVRGVVWHVANEASTADSLLAMVRDHFDLPADSERADILRHLRAHRRLIVIDNAESVKLENRQAYVELMKDMRAENAPVLVTSRVEWDEWEKIPVRRTRRPDPLTLPEAEQIVRDMAQAFGSTHNFVPIAEAFAEKARKHPKLIEFSIKLTEKFPPQKVMDDLAALKSKSISEALDEMIRSTVAQMVAAEGAESEAALKKLNVCRGGFTYEATRAILAFGDDTDRLDESLSVLHAWQFVTFADKRYSIDTLVIEAVGEDESAKRSHYDYYYALARQHDEKQDYRGLDVESANIEASFEWAILNDAEAALWLRNTCGDFLSNRGRFVQRLNWSERVVAAVKTLNNPDLLANAQNSLGVTLQELPTGDRRSTLWRAVAAYNEALRFYRAQAASLDYAMTQNNLGIAYKELATVEDKAGNLRRAVAAYTEALRFSTAQAAPYYYAGTQNNLGIAYQELAVVEDKAGNLRRAVEAYTEALRFYTARAAPLDYAMVQNNLGNGYRALAAVEDREGNLLKAVRAYMEALRFRTAEAAPLDYPMTQGNLGVALEDSGDSRGAVACWREAETYYRLMGFEQDADRMRGWIEDVERRLGEGDD